MIPTTLQEDAEKFAEFILANCSSAKKWVDLVATARWYISLGFTAVVTGEDERITTLVAARPVERPGLGVLPYYFNEHGKCLHVDMLVDISPDTRALMVVEMFLRMRFPQCTTITMFRHFEEKIHVYKLPEFWKSFEKIKKVKRKKKEKEHEPVRI